MNERLGKNNRSEIIIEISESQTNNATLWRNNAEQNSIQMKLHRRKKCFLDKLSWTIKINGE